MIHEQQPGMFGDSEKIIRDKKRLIENAAHIIAISENTKRDICRFTGTDPERVSVTHLATSIYPKRIPALDLPPRYILYVGNRQSEYKGLWAFLRAAGELLREDPGLSVVLAGGGPPTTAEQNYLPGRIHQIPVTADTIAHLYQQAELFVFPSRYEGFGIPLLESMTCGCPVVCTDIPVFCEVAGDAAVYYDPAKPGSLCMAMKDAMNNREELQRKGRARAALYSWQRTAEQTKRIYETVIRRCSLLLQGKTLTKNERF
jgi:glycosyltransferase involved in cell wall biosynthesis